MANIHDLDSSCRLLIKSLYQLVGDLDNALPHSGHLPLHSTQEDWSGHPADILEAVW